MESSFVVVSLLVGLFLVGTGLEYRRHQRRIQAIPHRIHVNGTRGKSSVTRLIGAGLRAGGLATLTKVTGTFPRLILSDGSDVPVHRKATASILEQLDIVDFAVARHTEVLVIECMALEPAYQRITEEQMIRATLGVFTNVRLDHTDVMGRTLEEVGATMAQTMPRGGRVLTAERQNLPLVRRLAERRGAELVEVGPHGVDDEAMAGFPYLEHRENVALALAVCAELGVDRQLALEGMWEAIPDAGVLTRSEVHEVERSTTFFNAFAANDPDSSLVVWNMLRDEGHLRGRRFVLLNSRADRPERSEQLAHLVARRLGPELDKVFVMGEPTDAVLRSLRSHGLATDRIVDLGNAKPEAVYRAVLDHTEERSSLVALGNMGGHGAATVRFFEERSREHHG